MNREEYLDTIVSMISLRGLTSHTVNSFKTYDSAYLDFVLDHLKTILPMSTGMI